MQTAVCDDVWREICLCKACWSIPAVQALHIAQYAFVLLSWESVCVCCLLQALALRRPALLSAVMLRQNPHNVAEWHKRVNLFKGDPTKQVWTRSCGRAS